MSDWKDEQVNNRPPFGPARPQGPGPRIVWEQGIWVFPFPEVYDVTDMIPGGPLSGKEMEEAV